MSLRCLAARRFFMAQTREERKAKIAQWWRNNRAKASEYRKRWWRNNPTAHATNIRLKKKHAEKIRKRNREYCRKNKEKVAQWRKKYRAADPEKYNESCRRSHKKHPEIMVNAKAKRRTRIGENRLSRGLTARLMIAQDGLCNHCKSPFGDRTPDRDHIIPLCKGGLNVDSNIQLLCRKCNQLKGSKLPNELTGQV